MGHDTLKEKCKSFGVSVEPPEEGKKLLERVSRTAMEDRSHIPLDPYPVRLLTDPDAARRARSATTVTGPGCIVAPITYIAGSYRESLGYVSDSAADRPSPVALAKAAVSVASGNKLDALFRQIIARFFPRCCPYAVLALR